MQITDKQLEATCNALLNAMEKNGYDTYSIGGEPGDLDDVGIASAGDIKTSLKIALETLGITVEQA